MAKKLFTKSTFKIALECPRRLYYAHENELYANQELNDDFLKSLAEGGFQVGELAKVYYGIRPENDIKVLDYDVVLEKTKKLLQNENICIAEGAFRYNNFLVRVDIIEKNGNEINLIEVKAKSWNPDNIFLNKKGVVRAEIRPYVYDVAFQKFVVKNALKEMLPDQEFIINAKLMMADKSKTATVDGLNQIFRICKTENGKSFVKIDESAWAKAANTPENEKILTAFDVDYICDLIINGDTGEQGDPNFMEGMMFQPFVELMSKHYCKRTKASTKLKKECFKCPYRKTPNDSSKLLDGYMECWKEMANFSDKDFDRPLIKDLWGQFIRKAKFIDAGKYFMEELTYDDLAPYAANESNGLDHLQRKWLQIAIATNNDSLQKNFGHSLNNGVYLDKDGLKSVMDKWRFPLHFIDFETSTVALPFYAGRRPYEQVAFQFSHHKVELDENGEYKISHADQYINTEKGFFPNFQFVRELKKALDGDNGTIFRYCTHENTILRCIYDQLSDSAEPDREELMTFINQITNDGERTMVDLAEVVLKYYYHPIMKGSYSIKVVLPAILNSSLLIKDKYSRAIYGTGLMPSLNLKDKVWIEYEDDGTTVKNPYKLLPSVSSYIDISDDEIERMDISNDETIANGGAALSAYAKLQFGDTKMSEALKQALLCYCELDTLAMVFIWEYFNDSCMKS